MKFTALLIMLFFAFPANAQEAMGKMSSSYQMKELQSFRTIDGSRYELGKQYRILKVPVEEKLNLQQKNALEKLLNSCGDCQEVPQQKAPEPTQEVPEIGGGPVIPVTPKPISTVLDLCKKYPGKFGCPK